MAQPTYQSKRNIFFDYFTKLVTINFIWFFTSFLGFQIFTLFPASVAGYVLVKSLQSRIEFPLFRSFIAVFKKEYVKSQKVMLLVLLMGLLIAYDLYYFFIRYRNEPNLFYLFGLSLFSLASLLFLMALIHLFPVYIYFPHYTAIRVLTKAFRMAVTHPFSSFYLLLLHVFVLVQVAFVSELAILYPLIYLSLMSFITLKVLHPLYRREMTDVIPLDVQLYIDADQPGEEIMLDLKQCQLIAHRGLSRLAPENSMAAFRLAGEHSFYGIEADIQATKDGVWVIFHDETLHRMIGHRGKLSELTYEEIKGFTLTSGYRVHEYPNEKIPRLEDFLSICRDYHAVPVVEVKRIQRTDQLDQMVQVLRDYGLYEKAIVISFHLDYLQYLRQRYSDLKMQYIVNEIKEEIIQTCKANRLDVDVNVATLTPTQIQSCHREGIKVNVWTVDDRSVAQRLIQDGVDYITTNVNLR